MGIIFALLVEATGSIISTMLVHFWTNAASVVMLYVYPKLYEVAKNYYNMYKEYGNITMASMMEETFGDMTLSAPEWTRQLMESAANIQLTVGQVFILYGPQALIMGILAFFVYKKIAIRNGNWHRICACFKKQTFDADLIFYPVRKQYGEKTFVPMGDGLQQDRLAKQPVEAVLDFIARCPKFPASPWGKIVRRDFLNRNQISFPLYVGHEDYDWTYMLLQHCQRFDFFASGMYTYRQIIGSRSSMQNPKNIQAHLELMERWVQMAVSADFRVHLNAYLAYQYSMALPFWGSLPAKQRKEYRVKMKRFRHLLDFGKTKKIKFVRYAVSLLGTENSAYLLYRYICMRNKRLELQ
jgi:hypothetical protein